MNKDAIIFWGSLFVWWIIFAVICINITKGCNNITSSPVEEMYHRQIVTTLDSILDARFGAGCCEKDIDSVNTNYFRTRFGGNLESME